MMRKIAFFAGLLLGSLITVLAYISYQINRLPANRPACFVRQTGKPVVVCVGASTVQGTFSYDFVAELEWRMGDAFQFVNAGVNGDLTYNVLKRLDEVIACRPDFVIVFIGGNDVNVSLNPEASKGHLRYKKVPHQPSLQWYRTELREIVTALRQHTSARIALLSQSVKGEVVGSRANQCVTEYTAVTREVADETQVAYLPLYERQIAYLCAQPGVRRDLPAGGGLMLGGGLLITAMVRHFLLRQSFDEIGEANRFLLLTEGVHLNSRSGLMIADLIADFLRSAPM